MPPEPLQADVLGPDYRVETISLPPDGEGPVVATLVTASAGFMLMLWAEHTFAYVPL